MARATQSTSECVTRIGSMVNGPMVNFCFGVISISWVSSSRRCSSSLPSTKASVNSVAYTGTFISLRIHGSPPMWSSWPWVRMMAFTSCRFSTR